MNKLPKWFRRVLTPMAPVSGRRPPKSTGLCLPARRCPAVGRPDVSMKQARAPEQTGA